VAVDPAHGCKVNDQVLPQAESVRFLVCYWD